MVAKTGKQSDIFFVTAGSRFSDLPRCLNSEESETNLHVFRHADDILDKNSECLIAPRSDYHKGVTAHSN